MHINSFTFKANKEGPVLALLGGVHGNEVCGPKALTELVEELQSGKIKLLSGTVIIIPICHEAAFNAGKRQIEENLNRVFCRHANPKTLEQQLANEIIPLIEKAAYVLDIHSFHQPGQAVIFQDYATDGCTFLTSALPAKYKIVGWPDLYDTAENGYSTERFAHEHNMIGATFEAGFHEDPQAVIVAKKAALNVLRLLHMIEGAVETDGEPQTIQMTDVIYKQKEGHFVRPMSNIELFRKGEPVVLLDDGGQIVMPDDGMVLLANEKAQINAEWFYVGHLKNR